MKARRIAVLTVGVLLVPFVAMQLTDEVDWQVGDFIVGGALLVAAGLTYELLAHRSSRSAHRATVGVAVAAVMLLVWTTLAVGPR